jgi:hypothetical protein
MFVASITKESINEGLDFACHLSTDAILDKGNSSPDKALELLQMLSSFIQYRYVGETLLALEELIAIGLLCSDKKFSFMDKETTNLFWSQIKWIVSRMDLSKEKIKALGISGDIFT